MSITAEITPTAEDSLKLSELPSGVIAPDITFESDIPAGSFVLDYHAYIAEYERRKKDGDRAAEYEEIGTLQDALNQVAGTDEEDSARAALEQKLANVTAQWGAEFDRDIISILQGILIRHKDITFKLKEGDRLFWYDKLIDEIEGVDPSDPNDWYEEAIEGTDAKIWRQKHPGRPDKEKIKLRICRISTQQSIGAKGIELATSYTEQEDQVAA